MITTALLVFFGLSACATTAIVAAVMLGARRATVHGATPINATETAAEPASVFAPAFSA